MKKSTIIIITICVLILIILAWSPWITKDNALNKVVNKLGGMDATFNYLGQSTQIKDIPKYVLWFPFVKGVYFENEAVWFVTFYGSVI